MKKNTRKEIQSSELTADELKAAGGGVSVTDLDFTQHLLIGNGGLPEVGIEKKNYFKI